MAGEMGMTQSRKLGDRAEEAWRGNAAFRVCSGSYRARGREARWPARWDFRTVTQIGEISFKERDFNKALQQAITERGPGWEHVQAYNGRDRSGRAKSGDKERA